MKDEQKFKTSQYTLETLSFFRRKGWLIILYPKFCEGNKIAFMVSVRSSTFSESFQFSLQLLDNLTNFDDFVYIFTHSYWVGSGYSLVNFDYSFLSCHPRLVQLLLKSSCVWIGHKFIMLNLNSYLSTFLHTVGWSHTVL